MIQNCNIAYKILIVHLQETDSTNLYIKRNLADFEEFSAVYTDYQNAGRGQSCNRWESEKGKNIMFSMLFKPRCGIELQYLLLYYVAHQVAEFIRGQIELKSLVSIKYPNDVLIGDKKIAGILIENSINGNLLENSIIGIGINVNQTENLKDYKATSLLMEDAMTRDINLLVRDLHTLLMDTLPYFSTYKISTYLENLYGYKTLKSYIDVKTQETFEARIIDVSIDGSIRLSTTKDEIRTYRFKEFRLL